MMPFCWIEGGRGGPWVRFRRGSGSDYPLGCHVVASSGPSSGCRSGRADGGCGSKTGTRLHEIPSLLEVDDLTVVHHGRLSTPRRSRPELAPPGSRSPRSGHHWRPTGRSVRSNARNATFARPLATGKEHRSRVRAARDVLARRRRRHVRALTRSGIVPGRARGRIPPRDVSTDQIHI